MCTPTLQMKVKKVAKMFASDEDEDEEEKNPRDRLKVMNYITGNNKFIEDSTIARANALYEAKAP